MTIKRKHNAKQTAHREVWKAVQNGALPNLKEQVVKCTDCSARATTYDHRDYEKPLEVEPVCQSCNMKRGTASYSEEGPMSDNPTVSVKVTKELHRILLKNSKETGRSIKFLVDQAIIGCYGNGEKP